jgi:hypothetical protein
MAQITLEIPEERYSDFLLMAGNWLADGTPSEPQSREPWTVADGVVAEAVLTRMTRPARRLFGMLAAGGGDVDDRKWSAQALTSALELNNANELAGTFAWPGRYCYQAGRDLPFQWEPTEDARGAHYWMPSDIGAMFMEALRNVDSMLHDAIAGVGDA